MENLWGTRSLILVENKIRIEENNTVNSTSSFNNANPSFENAQSMGNIGQASQGFQAFQPSYSAPGEISGGLLNLPVNGQGQERVEESANQVVGNQSVKPMQGIAENANGQQFVTQQVQPVQQQYPVANQGGNGVNQQQQQFYMVYQVIFKHIGTKSAEPTDCPGI